MPDAMTAALIDGLDEAALRALAEKLQPYLPEPAREANTWLSVPEAAAYLRCPTSRIYALKSADRIPFHLDGSRLLFRRSELDAWIRQGGGTRP
jgi:excisionase family DNA binding protein